MLCSAIPFRNRAWRIHKCSQILLCFSDSQLLSLTERRCSKSGFTYMHFHFLTLTLAYFLGSFLIKKTISSTCTFPLLPTSMALSVWKTIETSRVKSSYTKTYWWKLIYCWGKVVACDTLASYSGGTLPYSWSLWAVTGQEVQRT